MLLIRFTNIKFSHILLLIRLKIVGQSLYVFWQSVSNQPTVKIWSVKLFSVLSTVITVLELIRLLIYSKPQIMFSNYIEPYSTYYIF